MLLKDVVKGLANLRSTDTVKEWGERLMYEHRPIDLLKLPDFIGSSVVAATAVPKVSSANSNTPTLEVEAALTQQPPIKKLICSHCGAKISFAEGKFCWNNAKRFSGLQYCREHQQLFK